MIKVDDINVSGFDGALRGMRNPLNSWDKSDSVTQFDDTGDYPLFTYVGENDLSLMRRLFNGGTEHRKYLRMIHVQMDITAPLYWWKEFDTYKVGTVANSCSTMHTIHSRVLVEDDFSHDHLNEVNRKILRAIIYTLNVERERYLETKDKEYWWQMIQLLPSSFNQKRTVDFNYEVAVSMIHQRTGHKLDEWIDFVKVLHELPYMEEIIYGEKSTSGTS